MSTPDSHLMRPLLAIMTLSIFVVACSPETCYEDTDVFMKTFFFKEGVGRQTPDSLSLIGTGRESYIYHKNTLVQPALIPLDASANSCSFDIRINGVSDGLSIVYSTHPHFVSKECGYVFYHSVESVSFTKNIIDTIIICNNEVTTLNEENIRIYY